LFRKSVNFGNLSLRKEEEEEEEEPHIEHSEGKGISGTLHWFVSLLQCVPSKVPVCLSCEECCPRKCSQSQHSKKLYLSMTLGGRKPSRLVQEDNKLRPSLDYTIKTLSRQQNAKRKGKTERGKGGEGKGREGKGREGKGREGKGREKGGKEERKGGEVRRGGW
jgi:hypothetical protein